MSKKAIPALTVILLTGCASVPSGPRVAVMPGIGKNFEQFSADERVCRTHAEQSIGANVNEAGANNVLTGAAVGTVVGAAAGALLGGHRGAGGGAGAGLLMGSLMGAGNAGTVQHDTQRRYDIAYEQCMYSKGNQLPQAVSSDTAYYWRYYRPTTVYQAPTQTVILRSPQPQAVPLAPAPAPGVGMPPPPPPGMQPPP